MVNRSSKDDESSEVLDAREAARYLRINEQTMRRLARERELPAFKVGGSWRFNKSSLERWAARQEEKQRGRLVLVIDDEDTVRTVIRRSLEPQGYQVETASGGAEALDALQRHGADLIFLDLKMPKMSGPEVLSKIRENWGAIPVVILTAYPESELVEKMLEFSPITLLAKPAHPEKIVAVTNQILHPEE